MKQFVKIMLISMLTAGAVFGVSALPTDKPAITKFFLAPNPVRSGDAVTCRVEYYPDDAYVLIEILGAEGEIINYMYGGFNIERVGGAPGMIYEVRVLVQTQVGEAKDRAYLKII